MDRKRGWNTVALSWALMAGCSLPLSVKEGDSGAEGAADGESTGPEDGGDDAGRVDQDGDGAAAEADCDDTDPARFPGATELCNEVDDNCDGNVDEGVIDEWFIDADGDGHGAAELHTGCTAPENAVEVGDDCEDADPTRYPSAEELCNERDDDCDDEVDEGFTPPTWWPDADGDGIGGDGTPISACDPGSGWAPSTGDCDDADPTVFPGKTEDCDARDDDCSGLPDDTAACPCTVVHRGTQPYLFCTTGTDWAGAQATCTSVGYHLADVTDSTEDAWLTTTAAGFASTYWWMGANDISSEGTWTWESGEAWSYTHWCSGEPNNGHGLECVPTREEDCGVLGWQSGGCWNDYPCSCSAGQGQPYYSICEG